MGLYLQAGKLGPVLRDSSLRGSKLSKLSKFRGTGLLGICT